MQPETKIRPTIERAQNADPEGWINPYTTLMCPEKRWGLNGGYARWQHETYNAGCLIEAGVHHSVRSVIAFCLSYGDSCRAAGKIREQHPEMITH